MRRASRALWRSALCLLIAGVLACAFWPVAAGGEAGSPADAERCRDTIAWLAGMARASQSAHDDLSEGEINAYLAALLEHNPQARDARGLTVGLESLRVDLEPEATTLVVSARLAALPLTFESTFATLAEAEGAGSDPRPLRLRSLRVGHLPMVWPLKSAVASQLAGLLDHLHDERAVLAALTAVDVAHDRALLRIGAPAVRVAEER